MQSPYDPPTANLITLPDLDFDNTSGMGKGHPIPDGVKGWSWGGFLLTFLWAIGNRTWVGLLGIIPYAGWIMHFTIGFKGREWAWQNRHWDSVEHFNAVQRRWALYGLAVTLVRWSLVIYYAIPAYHSYMQRAASMH